MERVVEEVRVLADNMVAYSRECHSSIVFELAKLKKRFKITNEAGNCYSKTKVFVMLPDLSWEQVASDFDFDGNCRIDYLWDETRKRNQMIANNELALKYIKSIYY
jgi:hypothetical protein